MSESDKRAVIMLMSGEADRALIAFIVATGYAAMGYQTRMWFTLWGANCLKRRHPWWQALSGRFKQQNTAYRRTGNDSAVQNLIELLNRGGADHLPLSQHQLMGFGPPVFNYLLRRKGIPTLPQLIDLAEELDIRFTICQICVDALGLNPNDLVTRQQVEVHGVTQYVKDCQGCAYTAVF
jgi:peroxiredoxin family protein